MFFFNSSGKEVTVIMPQHFVYLFNAILLVGYKHILCVFLFFLITSDLFHFWHGQAKKRWKEKLCLIVPERIIEEK